MDTVDGREPSFKELPTRELKLKRHKVRRDSPTIPPVRLRLKSNTSPLNSETDTDKCFSDRSVSSSPDSVSQDLSPVFGPASYKVSTTINSLPSSPIANESNNDHSSAFVEHEDYDQPLDMSRKRSQVLSTECQNSHQQQLRPSVITCASALLRTQCNLSDLAHHMCTANVNDCNSNDIDDNQYITDHRNSKRINSEIKGVRPGHRREIVSGSCDPVIDEHFRRSLGKDYQHIFSKASGNSVSITVDDHFAKALGDTWHQLQQSKTVATDPVRTTHSPNSP
ncbi:Transcription cofactor vestigial-like protein 4, partial [Stegodyphus mimosarum]